MILSLSPADVQAFFVPTGCDTGFVPATTLLIEASLPPSAKGIPATQRMLGDAAPVHGLRARASRCPGG